MISIFVVGVLFIMLFIAGFHCLDKEMSAEKWKKQLNDAKWIHARELEETKLPPALPPTPFTEGYRGNHGALVELVAAKDRKIEELREEKDREIREKDTMIEKMREQNTRLASINWDVQRWSSSHEDDPFETEDEYYDEMYGVWINKHRP